MVEMFRSPQQIVNELGVLSDRLGSIVAIIRELEERIVAVEQSCSRLDWAHYMLSPIVRRAAFTAAASCVAMLLKKEDVSLGFPTAPSDVVERIKDLSKKQVVGSHTEVFFKMVGGAMKHKAQPQDFIWELNGMAAYPWKDDLELARTDSELRDIFVLMVKMLE